MERLVLTQADTAQALGVSERTLERWRVEGRGPRFVKLGKKVAYTETALRDYIEKNQHGSTSEAAA